MANNDIAMQDLPRTNARVLVASALAEIVEPILAQHFVHVDVVRNEADLDQLVRAHQAGAEPFDVAVVDLLWSTFDSQWTFDGLDVLSELERSGLASKVVLALQGHDAERDHLDEAYGHRLVRGAMVKGNGLKVLIESIHGVHDGERVVHPDLPAGLDDPTRLTVDRWLREHDLVAEVAGAVASQQANDWQEVAEVTSFAYATVRGCGFVFGEALAEFGAVAPGEEVNQAVIFRWCGEHARYIVSWCRRNGYPQFTRRSRAALT